MIEKPLKALNIFLHPQSPAAVYRRPRRLVNNVTAYTFNSYLKFANKLWPGDTIQCNICGFTGHRFGYIAAVSTNYFKADEICLNCGSNGRTRALIELFSRYVILENKPLTVADIGAAAATRLFFARYPQATYWVVDRYKAADVNSDITDIGLPDNAVEGLLCCHVLEHIDDYPQGIAELFRILKPGYFGVIAVPQTSGLKQSRRTHEKVFQGYGHVWEFGDDFADLLRAAGFEVTTHHLPDYEPLTISDPAPYHVVRKPGPT